MMDDIKMDSRGRILNIEWMVTAGKTFMSAGFSADEGREVKGLVVGDPMDITFQTGIKDTDNIMNYVEGEDIVDFTYEVPENGRYYFFVINLCETEDLHIEASIAR